MGASLVLLGLAGRAVGPSLRYRRSSETGDVLKAEELVARVAWTRFCSSLGAAVAIGGLFLLVVTAITMAIRIGDTAATVSVGIALLAVIVLMVVWTWAFVDRFGLYGIVADRPRTVSTPKPPKADTRKEKNNKNKRTLEPIVKPVTSPPATAGTPAKSTAQPASEPEKPRQSAAKRALQPWSTPAEPDPPQQPVANPEPNTTPVAARSEVINPSDAAALDRILSEPDVGPAEPDEEIASTEPVDAPEPEPESKPSAVPEDSNPIPAAPWNTRKHQRR
jgi:hypothetical protein